MQAPTLTHEAASVYHSAADSLAPSPSLDGEFNTMPGGLDLSDDGHVQAHTTEGGGVLDSSSATITPASPVIFDPPSPPRVLAFVGSKPIAIPDPSAIAMMEFPSPVIPGPGAGVGVGVKTDKERQASVWSKVGRSFPAVTPVPATEAKEERPPAVPTFSERAIAAESILKPTTVSHITKAEDKTAKRLSKFLKKEGHTGDRLFKGTLKELDKLQTVARKAAKAESEATASHTKALNKQQKLQLAFFDAKTAFETAQVDAKSKADALDAIKEQTIRQSQLLQDKTQEVEWMRKQKAVEDREREAKLQNLATRPSTIRRK